MDILMLLLLLACVSLPGTLANFHAAIRPKPAEVQSYAAGPRTEGEDDHTSSILDAEV